MQPLRGGMDLHALWQRLRPLVHGRRGPRREVPEEDRGWIDLDPDFDAEPDAWEDRGGPPDPAGWSLPRRRPPSFRERPASPERWGRLASLGWRSLGALLLFALIAFPSAWPGATGERIAAWGRAALSQPTDWSDWSSRLQEVAREAMARGEEAGIPLAAPRLVAPPPASKRGDGTAAGPTAAAAPEGRPFAAQALPVDAPAGQPYGWQDPSGPSPRFHGGLDFQTLPGEPVRAIAAGVVLKVETLPGGPIRLTVAHGGGWSSIYEGLESALAEKGERVAAGQTIGRAGGARPGHAGLHLALLRGPRSVDPAPYLGVQEPDAPR